jgi:hypothetical protein
MKPRVMAELLTQYVDRIIASRDDTEAYLELFHNHARELVPLFGVVKTVRGALVKQEPSPIFLENLGLGLRLAAQQAAHEQAGETRTWTLPTSRRTVVWGAAALGSLAWVAAMLVLSRSRSSPPTHTAA